MGSGVVLDVCKDLNIDATGIEINKKAYDYAKSKNKNFRFIYSDLLNYEKNN